MCNGDIHDDLYRYKDINEKFVVSHGDFLNVKILVEINNFLKAHTILYQFIKRITPLSNLFKDIKNENNNDFDNYDLEKVLSILNNKPDQKHIVDKKEFDKWGKSGLDKSKVHLQKIKKLLDENKIGLTLVYLEEPIFMLNSINSSTYYNFWNKFSQENKIDFIFVNEYHKDKKDKFEIYKKFFFIGDNHFNDKGNKAVAEEIFRKSKYFQKIIKLNQ